VTVKSANAIVNAAKTANANVKTVNVIVKIANAVNNIARVFGIYY
jgi:hypothetical protein